MFLRREYSDPSSPPGSQVYGIDHMNIVTYRTSTAIFGIVLPI